MKLLTNKHDDVAKCNKHDVGKLSHGYDARKVIDSQEIWCQTLFVKKLSVIEERGPTHFDDDELTLSP